MTVPVPISERMLHPGRLEEIRERYSPTSAVIRELLEHIDALTEVIDDVQEALGQMPTYPAYGVWAGTTLTSEEWKP